MEVDGTESTPVTTVVTELERLRSVFREAIDHYAQRIDSEILEIQELISAESNKTRLPAAKMRDIRDMLTVLRQVQIKSEKGRRKDIKKIDSLVGDLQMLVENW